MAENPQILLIFQDDICVPRMQFCMPGPGCLSIYIEDKFKLVIGFYAPHKMISNLRLLTIRQGPQLICKT